MPIFPGSRYQNGDVMTIPDKNGVRQLTIFRGQVVVGKLREFIVLRQGTRLDMIADTVYGDATKWWVIADANPNIAPDGHFDNIPAGTVLRVPDAPPSN